MGLSEYLRVIWRRKWRILTVALVLAATVYARSDSRPEAVSYTHLTLPTNREV